MEVESKHAIDEQDNVGLKKKISEKSKTYYIWKAFINIDKLILHYIALLHIVSSHNG